MAEYYPLLARAVAGMRSAPAEQRLAIYDRARGALLGQLRSMQPPVPVESIDRESTALDEAITRLESEIAVEMAMAAAPLAAAPLPPTPPEPPRSGPVTPHEGAAGSREAAEPAQAPAPSVVPPEPPAPAVPSTPSPAAPVPAAPLSPVATPPVAGAATPPSDAPAPPWAFSAPRTATARPAADALNRIVAERGPVAPTLRATRLDDGDTGSARAAPLPAAPRLKVPSFAEVLDSTADKPEAEPVAAADALAPSPPREDVQRPSAPRPVTRERSNPRALILALVGVLVVAGIAYAAWRLRDKPEALAKARAAMIAAQQAEQKNAKVSTRAEDTSGTTAAPPAKTAPDAGAEPETAPALTTTVPEAPTTAGGQPASGTSAQAPAQPQVPASSTPLPVTPQPSQAPTAGADVNIPVTQRAALLIDAPNDPQKVKTYVGTVIWSAENAAPTQGNQPIARTVHADIDIPEAGMKLAFVLQKNFETQFPASHTLDLHFAIAPNSTIGAIKEINVPQMRQDAAPAGDPLVGLPVTITENYFLVGLSRGEATAKNLDLIKSRNWFDIPMLLTSGRVAKLTFEKGTTGQKAIDDVLQSWQ